MHELKVYFCTAFKIKELAANQMSPKPLVSIFAGRESKYLAEKIANLRIFEDDNGKLNLSLLDVQGDMLVVSQFTLLGDCRKGRRPSFIQAAPPEIADRLYLQFVESVRKKGVTVETGRFQAMMAVKLINDGPVTLVLESPAT